MVLTNIVFPIILNEVNDEVSGSKYTKIVAFRLMIYLKQMHILLGITFESIQIFGT